MKLTFVSALAVLVLWLLTNPAQAGFGGFKLPSIKPPQLPKLDWSKISGSGSHSGSSQGSSGQTIKSGDIAIQLGLTDSSPRTRPMLLSQVRGTKTNLPKRVR